MKCKDATLLSCTYAWFLAVSKDKYGYEVSYSLLAME